MDSIKFVLIENYELHDIVKTDNVGPGSVFHDMDLYISLAYNKNVADEEKYLHAFRKRVYNLHLIQLSARYMLDTCMFDSNILLTEFDVGCWSRVPGVGPGFYSFPSKRPNFSCCFKK